MLTNRQLYTVNHQPAKYTIRQVIVRPLSTVEYTSVASVSTVDSGLTNLINERLDAWTSQARTGEWVMRRYLTADSVVEIGRKSRSWIKQGSRSTRRHANSPNGQLLAEWKWSHLADESSHTQLSLSDLLTTACNDRFNSNYANSCPAHVFDRRTRRGNTRIFASIVGVWVVSSTGQLTKCE